MHSITWDVLGPSVSVRHAVVLLVLASTASGVGTGPLLAGRHHEAPPLRERVDWQRDDLMPANQHETVRLKAVLTTREGVPVTTRICQVADATSSRLESLVREVPGEELTGAMTRDLNDDGIQEVLLRFSPPRNQSLVRLIMLCYSRADRRWVEAWETGPETGLAARFMVLRKEPGLVEWGVALERKTRGAATATETIKYRFSGEKLHEMGRDEAVPASTQDQLAWGLRWAKQGDLVRARDALSRAVAGIAGPNRARGLLELARVQLALGQSSDGHKTLKLLVNEAPDPPYTAEAERLLGWLSRPPGELAGLPGLVRAQLALDGGRMTEALERAAGVMGSPIASRPGPWLDEALMIQAQVHLAANRKREAIRCLMRLVAECPDSASVKQAQSWLYQLDPPPR
ncbi:MAG: tetratricopeptide repeat protein [Candidatus Riflebacteria bacterium]|nr:tetratricopeptide repeat protein [Candidatus Riflebacteria bacterium]